jgi:DNA-binding transcriptional MerR regulator
MDKSADAFRTISEVADHLDTPAHVLRFWESRFPQIRPVKRAGGRRYYRPSDVSLLTGIKRLLHDEGMTIRGVQKILREQGVRHVAGLSGDVVGDVDDATPFDAPFIEQAEDVVVPLVPEPAPFRPSPGLAAAMAKVVDHGPIRAAHQVAPSTPLPVAEPAQGALLLTPIAVPDAEPTAVPVAAMVGDGQMQGGSAAVDQTAQDDALGASHGATVAQDAFPERSAAAAGDFGDDDFGDDDADDGPITTLATRIRALPPEASASKVGAELLGVVARLQALRDAMADAARNGAA